MKLNSIGARKAVFVSTMTLLPMNCGFEMRRPEEGRVVLQVESGVVTTKIQSLRVREERAGFRNGLNVMKNVPNALVVDEPTTINLGPHWNCTVASARKFM